MFFTGCFDIRVDIHLLCSDFNNQATLFSSPAFSGTQTPFFLPDRPTHHHQRRGDGKQTFYWDGPTTWSWNADMIATNKRQTTYSDLLYGKPSQIPALWLVLSRSGFCSTDRFHENGPTHVFFFRSEAGKFKICNQNSEKILNIVILYNETTRRSQKDWKIFRHFKDGCKRVILKIWKLFM